MAKTGLVLGGGGARGSYEVGVWEALLELSIKPDIVTGTSVGALNGAMVAEGDIEKAKKVWLSVDNAKILGTDFSSRLGTNTFLNMSAFAREFIERGGADASGLLEILRQNVSEERVRANSETLFGLVAVQFPSMKPEKLFIDEIPIGKLHHYLMASSAFFPAMRAYEMDGKTFVDGGYNDNLPINMAIGRGATSIIAVNLDAPGIVRGLMRGAAQEGENVKVTVIKPRENLGEILSFDRETAKRNMRLGYLDAMKTMHRLDGIRYTLSSADSEISGVESLFERELLRAGIAEGGNRALRTGISRTILKDTGRQRLTRRLCILHAIDCAAGIYGADITKIYSPAEICGFILGEFKKDGTGPIKSISLYRMLEKNVIKRGAFTALRMMSITRRDIVKAFAETLSAAEKKDDLKMAHIIARVFPMEFEAAILINCLTGRNTEDIYG